MVRGVGFEPSSHMISGLLFSPLFFAFWESTRKNLKGGKRMSTQHEVICPECGSKRNWKDGKQKNPDGTAFQRYYCVICDYRFISKDKVLDLTNLDQRRSSRNSFLKKKSTYTIICPKCDSKRTWKDGKRQTKFGVIQRYSCRDCSYRFS